MTILAKTTALILAATSAYADGAIGYTVLGQPYEGHLSTVDDARGIIVQFPTTRGLSDHEIGNAARFAAEGWSSFAVDVHGAGKLPSTMEERDAGRDMLLGDEALRLAIARAAIEEASRQTDGDIVVIGFSMGGGIAAEVARSGLGEDLGVDGYGIFSGRVDDRAGRMMPEGTAPIFVARGSADSRIAIGDLAVFEEDAEMAGVPYRIELYDGKDHMFHAEMSPNFDADAAGHVWAAFGEFLAALPASGG